MDWYSFILYYLHHNQNTNNNIIGIQYKQFKNIKWIFQPIILKLC